MLFNHRETQSCNFTRASEPLKLNLHKQRIITAPTPLWNPERPAIFLILLTATPTFISKSIDNYNHGEWLSPSLRFQRLLLKRAAGSVNGTIKIIVCTSPINKACFQLRAAIRLILIMEKPWFLHCSPFALFIPGASHILWAGFHVMVSMFY